MSDKIYIQRFNPMTDLEHLNEWLAARGMDASDIADTAGIGYIAFHDLKESDDIPVAVAFLRRCEGRFGILDGLCTNPKMPGEIRHRAIDLLVEKICKRASDYGLKNLLSWSVDTGTLERSLRHGFVQQDFTLITKYLPPR